MPTDHDHPAHELTADSADQLMSSLVDAREALAELTQAFRDAACRGCDPTGEGAAKAGRELFDRYQVDLLDGDWLLAQAADARMVMSAVLVPPMCDHDDDDEGDDDE